MQYHQQLGFAGTLLLCDLHQAHELMQLQDISKASEEDSLIIWPWVSTFKTHLTAGFASFNLP
jgi:hypothetical protein